jgi:hypothetical protein
MPVQRPRLDDDRRRALAVLAENPDGCSRAILIARGSDWRPFLDGAVPLA